MTPLLVSVVRHVRGVEEKHFELLLHACYLLCFAFAMGAYVKGQLEALCCIGSLITLLCLCTLLNKQQHTTTTTSPLPSLLCSLTPFWLSFPTRLPNTPPQA